LGQVFPAQYIRRAFGKADDERVRRIDVDAIVSAATAAFIVAEHSLRVTGSSPVPPMKPPQRGGSSFLDNLFS
jgi:hypothetical protein